MRILVKILVIFMLIALTTSCAPAERQLASETPLPPTPTHTQAPSATHTVSPTSTLTHTPAPLCPPENPPIPGWPVYCNDRYGFFFQYPPEADFEETGFNSARIDLPIEPDTNLGEKYLELIVQESSRACSSPLAEGYPPEMVERRNMVIEGKNFLKQSGSDAGAGNIYEWIAYSTGRDNLCVYFDFVLHSTQPFNYPTPPPEFDFDAETAVFEDIVGSLQWYTPE